ncbi:MAG: hypothetical protein PVJ85_16800, partial [Anaerolineae bacterium]
RTVFIDQQVNLAALLTSICGISTRFFTTQRCGTGFAINRLPFPTNFPFRSVVQHHFSHHVGEDALLLPSLKTFVNHTAANAKPALVNYLPLAANPQDLPNPIQRSAILSPRTARSSPLRRSWQKLAHRFPKLVGHFEAIDIFRFCGIILAQDTCLLAVVVGNSIIQQERLFC